MALLFCLRCATRFAVGLLACPHCHSEDFEEADVPKITVSGGVSHPEDLGAVSGLPGLIPVASAGPEAEVTVPEPEAAEPEPVVLKADLQQQAKELGLPVSGTKAQLADAVAAATGPESEPELKAAPSLSGPAKSG